MEPCLRSAECEPQRSGFDWKCGFCGVEMQMMRVLRPEPPPTEAELAERKRQAERLVALMTDPNPETEEERISRIFAEVRAEPEPRQNAGGPGCWRTPEPDEPVEVRMDVEGRIVSGSGEDVGVPVAWQPGDPPGGVAEIEYRWAENQDNIVGIRQLADFSDMEGHPRPGAGLGPEPDVLDVIAQEILDIGRTHGWEAFGQMVEQLKKEGL